MALICDKFWQHSIASSFYNTSFGVGITEADGSVIVILPLPVSNGLQEALD